MDVATHWARFRSSPGWAQLLAWVLLWPVLAGLYTLTQRPGHRRGWWALTGASAFLWLGIVGSASAEDEEPNTGQVKAQAETDEKSSEDGSPTRATEQATTTGATTSTTTAKPTTTTPTTSPPTTSTAPPPPSTTPPTTPPPPTVAEVVATAPPPAAGCTPGYDPCIPPAGDVNCDVVGGPVSVDHAFGDPYDLDRDSDGVGCEP